MVSSSIGKTSSILAKRSIYHANATQGKLERLRLKDSSWKGFLGMGYPCMSQDFSMLTNGKILRPLRESHEIPGRGWMRSGDTTKVAALAREFSSSCNLE